MLMPQHYAMIAGAKDDYASAVNTLIKEEENKLKDMAEAERWAWQ